MASKILARSLLAFPRAATAPRVASSVQHYSNPPPYYDPAEGKEMTKDVSMPDGLGGAVGLERWEMLQKLKGNNDPFYLDGIKVDKYGTKAEPYVVKTLADNRIIGCVCNEDMNIIRFTKMYLGETKRCQCGHFWKLEQTEPNF